MPHFFHSTELRIFFAMHTKRKRGAFNYFMRRKNGLFIENLPAESFYYKGERKESGLTRRIFLLQDQVNNFDVLEGFDELTDEIFIEFI